MTDSWWSAKLSNNSSLQAESIKCKDTQFPSPELEYEILTPQQTY